MAVWRSKLGAEFPRELIERLDSDHHATLGQLRREPANAACAECLTGDTNWASVNLGVFLCVRCADVHRSLGTHISKVKGCGGTYLWGPDEVSQMQAIGNARAAECYCGGGDVPKMSIDSSKEELVDFCLKKYAHRLWAPRASVTRSNASTTISAKPTRPQPASFAFAPPCTVEIPSEKASAPGAFGTAETRRLMSVDPMSNLNTAKFRDPSKVDDFDLESFFNVLDIGSSPKGKGKAGAAALPQNTFKQLEQFAERKAGEDKLAANHATNNVNDTAENVTVADSNSDITTDVTDLTDLADLTADCEMQLGLKVQGAEKVDVPVPADLKRADSESVWDDWGNW